MFRCLNFLLLLLFPVNYSETTPRPVTSKKGDSTTLECDFNARETSFIRLYHQGDEIPICKNEDCKSENGRVFKKRKCDVVIKDLIFSDAGKYVLRVYYSNDQTEADSQTTKYQLQIQDEISVRIGEELKLDPPLTSAIQVMHWNKTSKEWMEVWRRNTNENFIAFIPRDTGSYIVLGSEGETLINLTLKESGTKSGLTGKQNSTDDHETDDKNDDEKTDGTEQHSFWILCIGLPVFVVLALILTIVLICRCQNLDYLKVHLIRQ